MNLVMNIEEIIRGDAAKIPMLGIAFTFTG